MPQSIFETICANERGRIRQPNGGGARELVGSLLAPWERVGGNQYFRSRNNTSAGTGASASDVRKTLSGGGE